MNNFYYGLEIFKKLLRETLFALKENEDLIFHSVAQFYK
jgi:hypothetical protein